MSDISMKQRLQAFGIRRILNYLDSNPDENIPKVLDWVEKFDKDKTLIEDGPLPTVKRVLSDKDGVWYKFVRDLYSDVDDDVRKKVFENFIVNSVILGREKKIRLREEEGCNIPWAILMDPTSACN